MRIAPSSRPLYRQTFLTLFAVGVFLVSTSAPIVQASHVMGAHPGYGGTVSYASGPPPSCNDPNVSADLIVVTQIGDTLVTQDDHARLRPDLALRWSFSHGGAWMTFYLRHGVRFSNGDSFDASAVKYTLDRIRNPATHSPFISALNTVQAVKVVNRYTVRLVTRVPFRPVMTYLANPGFTIVDRKAVEQEGDRFCQYPVSTGAFMVKSVGPGFSTITLARNPYHTWEPPDAHNRGRAYLSSFVMNYIPDPTAEVSELLIGDADISAVAGDQLDRVRHNPDIELHRVVRFGEYYLTVLCGDRSMRVNEIKNVAHLHTKLAAPRPLHRDSVSFSHHPPRPFPIRQSTVRVQHLAPTLRQVGGA